MYLLQLYIATRSFSPAPFEDDCSTFASEIENSSNAAVRTYKYTIVIKKNTLLPILGYKICYMSIN